VQFRDTCDQVVEVGPGPLGWLEKLRVVYRFVGNSHRPEVVVCGIDEHSLSLGLLVARRAKIPVFCFVEDPPFTDRYTGSTGFRARVEKRLRTCLVSYLLDRCTGIFCFIEKEVLREFNLKKSQIYQMMNSPSALAREWAQRQSKCMDGDYVVGFVGALTPAQGLDTLLEICSEARRRIPHLKLRLIGPLDSGYKREYQITAKKLGFDSLVELTGWLPYFKMLEKLKECAVGVYCNPPTEWFRLAHPLKICEYLALAKPTVAWDYPGTRRILDDGRFGVLVPPGEKSALVDALVSLGDVAVRKRIENEIHLAVEERWSTNYWYGKVLETIQYNTYRGTGI
jgi:glycosyltransferase involved in cell wall biosynthesis